MSSKETIFRRNPPERLDIIAPSNDGEDRRRSLGRSSERLRPDSSFALEELVQCPICLERFQYPKMLQCQHTFCLACLQNHVVGTDVLIKSVEDDKQILLRCPTCKQEVTIDGAGGLESLPENLYINNLLRVINLAVETPGSPDKPEIRCAKCETVDLVTNRCNHCKQVFCMVCWTKHMNELQEKLFTMVTQLEDSEVRLSHKMDEMERRFKQLNVTIKEQTEAKIAELRAKEEELLQQVDGLRSEEVNTSTSLKTKIEDLRDKIKNLNFKIVGEQQQVSLFMTFHRNTSFLLEEVSQWGENRTVFDPETFKLEEDKEGLNADEDYPKIQDPLENSGTLTKHYKTRSFTPKFHTNKFPRLTGIAVSPWSSHFYIAAPDSQAVLIMNRQKNKLVGKLTSSELLCPRAVVISKNKGEIYVTDKWKHCIHVFSSHGEYLRMICSKGTAEGKLISPEGIAITQDDQLVVCDTGNDRVLILDPDNGTQIGCLGWKGKRALLNMPTTVAVTEDNKVVIADNGNHRIKIFSMSGEFLSEFGSLGRDRKQLRSAEVVALDSQGFIFVGDAGNSRVQIFDQSGHLIRIFGGVGTGPGKFSWISGIAITSQLEIVITDHKNRSLQIF